MHFNDYLKAVGINSILGILVYIYIAIINTITSNCRDGEWTQTLAGLIPSLELQEHRMAMQKQSKEVGLYLLNSK